MVAALITFDQGGPGTPGQAFEGTTSVLVTVTNDDNTDVTSWSIDLLDVPSDSALVPGNLGAAANNTPTASFTPDVPGAFRVSLTVSDGSDSSTDIRNFGIRNSRGIIFPPYQKLPDPIPVTGTGTPVDKPDELNFGGVSRGWSGNPTGGMFEQFVRTYDDLPRLDTSSTSLGLTESGAPLTVVDLDAAGASSTLTLPVSPRTNHRVRILATGTTAGRVVTVQAGGGGTIAPFGAVDIPLNGFGTFVHLGSNVWRALGAKSDLYERTIVGGLETTDQTSFVSIGTAALDMGNFVNVQAVTFQAVVETTSVPDPVEIRLFNITTQTVVGSSTVQSPSLTPAVVTADITGTVASGLNIYEAQLRLQSTGAPERASCKQAQIIVDWVQV